MAVWQVCICMHVWKSLFHTTWGILGELKKEKKNGLWIKTKKKRIYLLLSCFTQKVKLQAVKLQRERKRSHVCSEHQNISIEVLNQVSYETEWLQTLTSVTFIVFFFVLLFCLASSQMLPSFDQIWQEEKKESNSFVDRIVSSLALKTLSPSSIPLLLMPYDVKLWLHAC